MELESPKPGVSTTDIILSLFWKQLCCLKLLCYNNGLLEFQFTNVWRICWQIEMHNVRLKSQLCCIEAGSLVVEDDIENRDGVATTGLYMLITGGWWYSQLLGNSRAGAWLGDDGNYRHLVGRPQCRARGALLLSWWSFLPHWGLYSSSSPLLFLTISSEVSNLSRDMQKHFKSVLNR